MGEGEKSGCEGGGGEAAGEVGVGEGKVLVVVDLLVVVWRRVVGPVDVACL